MVTGGECESALEALQHGEIEGKGGKSLRDRWRGGLPFSFVLGEKKGPRSNRGALAGGLFHVSCSWTHKLGVLLRVGR